MGQPRHFLQTAAQARREAQRKRIAEQRSNTPAARAFAEVQRAYGQSPHRTGKDSFVARQLLEAQAAFQDEELTYLIQDLERLLLATLPIDDHIDLAALKGFEALPTFSPGRFVAQPENPPPSLEAYLPPPLSLGQKLLPMLKKKYEQEVEKAKQKHAADHAAHAQREAKRQAALAEARTRYERQLDEVLTRNDALHTEIEKFERQLQAGHPETVAQYFAFVLEASLYPEGFPQHGKLVYVPESKQLVVDYDFPPFDVIPEVRAYKYTKSKGEITTTARPLTQRKALYSSVVAQVTLRTLHELFEADRTGLLETIAFNGFVHSIDKGTGHPTKSCLATVRTTRETFMALNLGQVDPISCLKTLNASVSKSPAELAPVRPVVELNMVDSRFIEEVDVLSTLDQRLNLMDLTPSEFEALISNLFKAMGLETRLTQASNDGGVDCVAFDPRPILGGKVVIQAKRYKNTVGVSAVRDLYGTMQNEGASKGILVTTSGYGKAAYKFAEGKPLELLSGSNLLYLLSEYAKIEAKIVMPENWKDPKPDSVAGE